MELTEVTRAEVKEFIQNGGCVFFVLDQTGDTKYGWDPNSPVEVEIARTVFYSYKEKGYAAFREMEDGSQERMDEFNPRAGKVSFVPPMKGG